MLNKLGLFLLFLILLFLFEEGGCFQNLLLLLLLGAEHGVRIVRPAGVALALGEGSVAVPVRLVVCVLAYKRETLCGETYTRLIISSPKAVRLRFVHLKVSTQELDNHAQPRFKYS